jgi:hypothetical protein
VQFPPPVLDSIQHFLGKDFLQSKTTTVLESLFSANVQSLREGGTQFLDAASARALCFLLETLLVSPGFTQSELMITACAITSGVTQSLSHASTTLQTLLKENEISSASDLTNSEELETLQLNFYSLQKKCSALLQLHENYKEQKEAQLLGALEQCKMLKAQVAEAASFSIEQSRNNDEIKRLTLALCQAEKAADAQIISNDVALSR